MRFGPDDTLGGYLLGVGSSYVVLAHQSDGNSCQMLPLARRLAGAGYRVLAFDFPGVGASQLTSPSHPYSEDVTAAVEAVRDGHPNRIALVGASVGGYAALGAVTAERLPAHAVQAVVALSAPREYPDGGRRVDVSHLSTPLRLVVGRDDVEFFRANEALASQDGDAELQVINSYDHGVDLVDRHVFRGIDRFLQEHLR